MVSYIKIMMAEWENNTNENMDINMDMLKEILEKAEIITLSTSKDDIVTSRVISPLYIGNTIYLRTSGISTKAVQMKANPNVALCMDVLYMESKARGLGHFNACANKEIKNKYMERHQWSFGDDDVFLSDDEEFFAIDTTKI